VGGSNTSGFDFVMAMDTSAINDGLKRFDNKFPKLASNSIVLSVNDPITGQPITNLLTGQAPKYTADVKLKSPSFELISTTGQAPYRRVRIAAGLDEGSGLTLEPGQFTGYEIFGNVTLKAAGSVRLECDLAIEEVTVDLLNPNSKATGRAVVAKLDTATVTFVFTGELSIGTKLFGSVPIKVDAATLQQAFGPLVQTLKDLFKNWNRLILTMPIPVPGPATLAATTLTNIDFSGFSSGDGLAVGLVSACGAAANAAGLANRPSDLTRASDPKNDKPLKLTVSNAWRVCLICNILAAPTGPLPGATFTIDMGAATGTMNGTRGMTAPDGTAFTLTSLVVTAPGGIITVTADASVSGFCWSATPRFMMSIGVDCNSTTGVITPTMTVSSPPAPITLSFLCVIAAAVIGGILGAIILGLTGAIAGAVIFGLVAAGISISPPLTGAIAGAFNTFGGVALPLPVAAYGLKLGSCVVDDLEVAGQAAYTDVVPRRSFGVKVLASSSAFNLDTGTVTPVALGTTAPAGTDLEWTGSQLLGRNGTEIGTLFKSFDDVTLADLESLNYPLAGLQAAQLPQEPQSPLVFGARTSEGLYARCASRRTASSDLELNWVTYQQPSASLSLQAKFATTQTTVIDEGSDICTTLHIEPSPPLGSLEDLMGTLGAPTDGPRDTGTEIITEFPLAGVLGVGQPSGERVPSAGRFTGGGVVSSGAGLPPITGGFGVQPPSVADLAKKKNTKFTVVRWHEVESAPWYVVDRAQRGTIRANPDLLSFPMTLRWTVFGHQVPTDTGSITIGDVTVNYDEDSVVLVLEAALGVDVVGTICCTAVDADGRRVTTCINVKQAGRVKVGGCRDEFKGVSFLDFVGFAREFGGVLQGAQVASAQLNAIVGTAPAFPAVGPARPIREALKDAVRVED
jgi:hypothetical protein